MRSSKKIRIRKRVLAFLAIVLFVSAYLIFSIFLEKWIIKEQDVLIRNSMEDIFNGRVSIRGVDGNLVNTLSIQGLRVYEKEKLPRFSAENLIFKYDIAGLLIKKMPVSLISIYGGHLNLERTYEGQWNFMDLFKKGNSPGQLYIPRIDIDSSSVRLCDMIFQKNKSDRLPLIYDLLIKYGKVNIDQDNVLIHESEAYLKDYPQALVFLKSKISFKDIDEAHKRGIAELDDPDFLIDKNDFAVESLWNIKGTNIPLKPFGRYISDYEKAEYLSGNFDFILSSEASAVQSRKIMSNVAGEVKIQNGHLYFAPLDKNMEKVNGKIGFSESGWAMGGLNFNIGKLDFTVVQGGINKKKSRDDLNMKLKAYSASLGDFIELFGITSEASGEIGLNLDIKQLGDFVEYYGDIKCKKGKYGSLAFENGVFLFSRYDTKYDFSKISLETSGGSIQASGSADHTAGHLPFAVDIKAFDLNLDKFKDSMPKLAYLGLSGNLSGAFKISGDFYKKKLSASGFIELKNVSVLGLEWKKIKLLFSMKENILTMDEIKIEEGPETPLTCKGITIDLNEKDPAYCFEVEIGRADLKTIKLFIPENIFEKQTFDGVLEYGNVKLFGKGLAKNLSRISADLRISDFIISGHSFKEVNAKIEYSNKEIIIKSLGLRGIFGDLDLKGKFSKENGLSIKCKSSSADFIKFLKPYYPDIGLRIIQTGQGWIEIDVSGSLAEPSVLIKAGIKNLDVAGYALQNIEGTFEFAEKLIIKELKCGFNGIKASAFGSYDLFKGLELFGELNSASIKDIFSVSTGITDKNKSFKADFIIKGLLKHLNYSFNVNDFVLFESPLMSCRISAEGAITPLFSLLYKGEIYFNDPQKIKTPVLFSGNERTFHLTGKSIKFDGIPLFSNLYKLIFDLDIKLDILKSQLKGKIDLSNVKLNKLKFPRISSDLIIKDGVIKLKKGIIPKIGRVFGTYDLKKQVFDFETLVIESSAAEIISRAIDDNPISFKKITGKLNLSGPASNPELKIKANFHELVFFDMPLDGLSLEAYYKKDLINILSAVFSYKNETAGLSASIKAGEIKSFNLKINNFDNKRFNKFLKKEFFQFGNSVMSFGLNQKNQIKAFFSGSGFIKKDIFYSGSLIIAKKGIELTSLVLKTGDSSVNLNGLVSFPDEAASEIILKQEKMSIASYFSNYIKVLKNFRIPLDLKVKSSNLKVSDFFSLIDNKVQIKGLIDLNLNISGFLDSPMLSGSCFAKNVMLVLDILKQPIEISDLAVKGKNNRFNIESSGLVRENEQIQSTGEILLDLTGVRGILKKFNLSFILKGYKFRGNQGIRKDFKKEISFAGIIDSKVNVSGEYDDFFIDSEVIVSNSALSFSLSEKKPVQVPGFLNDRVKLKIKLGKNVWFRNNIISTELDGDFQAGVHESELVLNGKIHLLRGKFNYFSNEFDIIEGHIRLNMLMESSDETDFYNLSTADLGLNLDLGRLRLKKTDFSIDTKRHQISLIKGDADIDKRSSININLRGKTNLKGVDIYTVITGSMEDLQMSFYSDPPQDQVYIETLLTRGELLTVSSDPKRSGQDAINLMGAELTNALWKKFSFSLAENFNLSEFSIKSSSNRSGGFKGPAVQFGKYLDDDLYFSYKRIFAEENEETLGLEYHFRRRVILDTELKRNQESDDFTMGLKFKRSF